MPPEPDHVVVEVETLTGARYAFPDMPRTMLTNILRATAWEHGGRLVLVNASGATLTVPLHLVQRVVAQGKEEWSRAPVHELPADGRA
jgi:hypothetical protein